MVSARGDAIIDVPCFQVERDMEPDLSTPGRSSVCIQVAAVRGCRLGLRLYSLGFGRAIAAR